MTIVDERDGCMTEGEAQDIRGHTEYVAFRAQQLAEAWQQDQQKAKWREYVRWCHDELAVALAHLQEELDR